MSDGIKRALIVAPHQDDEIIGCGGTIVFLKDKGFEIAVVHVFKGTTGVNKATPSKAYKLRQKEASDAAKILGYKLFPNLAIEDRNYTNITLIQNKLIKIFRHYEPNIVLAPHKNEQDKEHKLVSAATWEASWLSSTPNFKKLGKPTDSIVAVLCYEVWTPIKNPNLYVDTTPFKNQKEKALSVFKSQLQQASWAEGAIGLNRYRGATLQGKGLAESFVLRATNLNEFTILFTNE